jgi:hypothetical protein
MAGMQKAKKTWAVLAYTIAEDTSTSTLLDTTARRELKAICDAADFRRVSVAAQVDFKSRRGIYRGALTQLEPKGRGFRDISPEDHALWKQIKDGVEAGRSAVRLQREARDLNAAQPDVLEDFLRFGRDECPAEHYVVSFFGHAAGPLGVFSDTTSGSRVHDTLRLPALVGAFRGATRRADVVMFRDCFMSCLEAAYQLRTATEFVVATQALAPATGAWPWRDFMRALTDDASPYDVGLGLTQALAAFLDDPAHRPDLEAVPYTLLDLGAVTGVAARLKALVPALEAARRDPARRRACARALEASRVGSPARGKLPGDPALVDVPTLCGDPVAAPAAALGEAVRSTLVRWHHSQTPHHRGVSLFYKPVRPEQIDESYLQASDATVASDDAAHYRALALSRATGWHRIALDPLPIDD